MGIKDKTSYTVLESHIKGNVERWQRDFVRKLSHCGEQCVNMARGAGDYKDQTGNLKSSVGYAVSVDGVIVDMSGFDVVKEGVEGHKNGMDYVMEVASRYREGVALIVVAGMEYAAYVNRKGYDVIDSAELLAERIVPEMLEQIRKGNEDGDTGAE